jgi:hypothetical protein
MTRTRATFEVADKSDVDVADKIRPTLISGQERFDVEDKSDLVS